MNVLLVMLLPFFGTVLGAGLVFFLRREMNRNLHKILSGFAAGVMVAASIWSLLLPAMEQSAHLGKWAFLPAFLGLWAGIVFLLVLDRQIPHLHICGKQPEGVPCCLGRSTMLALAVGLHNFPEGMAVGVVAAGWLTGNESISFAGALALSLGIALQNLPEGAIISMPLRNNGMTRRKAFFYGVLSGAVEPLGAILVIMMAGLFMPVLPCFLSFAAGAMLYVVVEDLIPQTAEGNHSDLGTFSFGVGFSVMMVLDVALE